MNKINSLRQEKNLTLKELADILGVSEATVSRWENGKSEIRGKNLKKLADFFDVSESYLLGYIEIPSLPNRLRELRKEKKISIEQLSTKVGIDESRIAALESKVEFENIEKNDAYYSDVKKLADFFNTTIDYLEGVVGYREDIFFTDLASAIFQEFSSTGYSTLLAMKYLSRKRQKEVRDFARFMVIQESKEGKNWHDDGYLLDRAHKFSKILLEDLPPRP